MSNTTPVVKADKVMELLATGNLDQFTPTEKLEYVTRVCEATGLNPLTRPFDFIRFQGKTVLYASKGCTDQLRKIHNISIKVIEKEIKEGVFFVTVEASDKSGRIDSDIGALSIAGLKGDVLANAVMKGITKAKRRVTLSICGLGMLDESEVETIKGAEKVSMHEEPKQVISPVDYDNKRAMIEEIKGMLSVISKEMTPQEKGALLFSSCNVRKFDDLGHKEVDDLSKISLGLVDLMGKMAK